MLRLLMLILMSGLQVGCLAAGMSPAERQLCEGVHQRRYEPTLSPVKSKDPVLRLVLESTDSATLTAGLSQTDLNAQRGTTGLTALGAAASAGNLVAVRVLLASGAGMEVRSRSGETALESAVIHAQASTACWLLQQGAQLPAPGKKPYLLPAAALSEDFAAANTLVRLLLERGFSPDARMNGDTALHIASELGNVDLIKVLIQRSADIAARNSRGETPLVVAKANGHQTIVKLLTAAKGR